VEAILPAAALPAVAVQEAVAAAQAVAADAHPVVVAEEDKS
jgi:hypothetical protein